MSGNFTIDPVHGHPGGTKKAVSQDRQAKENKKNPPGWTGGFCEDYKSGRRSRVQRFRGSRFHSYPRTAFGMRIYDKSVSFVSSNPKFEAKLAINWENEHF